MKKLDSTKTEVLIQAAQSEMYFGQGWELETAELDPELSRLYANYSKAAWEIQNYLRKRVEARP